jgi:hypothetical protein
MACKVTFEIALFSDKDTIGQAELEVRNKLEHMTKSQLLRLFDSTSAGVSKFDITKMKTD